MYILMHILLCMFIFFLVIVIIRAGLCMKNDIEEKVYDVYRMYMY